MPAPSFLNTGAVWDTVSADDVQAAIDMFDDLVSHELADEDQWAWLGGNDYQTPTLEPAGAARKFFVTLTRASQTVLEVLTKDQNGLTVFDGEIHLSGTTEIKVFVGPWHYAIQFLYDDGGPTYELALGAICDPRPLPLSSHGVYVAAKTTRDDAGSAVSNSTRVDNWVMRDAALGSGHVQRMASLFTAAASSDGRTSGGSNFHLPAEQIVQPTAANLFGSAGKLMQFILSSEAHPPGSVLDIPISDDGGVGEFEVLGLTNAGGGYSGLLAVRRSAP